MLWHKEVDHPSPVFLPADQACVFISKSFSLLLSSGNKQRFFFQVKAVLLLDTVQKCFTMTATGKYLNFWLVSSGL